MGGQWKLCRALLRSIHNDILSSKENGSSLPVNPRDLQSIRGTHSFILRECAKQGSLYPALWYTNDIQEFAKKTRSKRQIDQDVIAMPHFTETPSTKDDIFEDLRIF